MDQQETVQDRAEQQRLAWAFSFASGYYELGMLAAAEHELDRIPHRDQERPEVMSLRSHVLLARRNWSGVVEHTRRAVVLFPEVPEFYIHGVTAFDMLGRSADGRRLWESGPENVRSSASFHLHVARFEAHHGNLASARDHLSRAFLLDPATRAIASRDPGLTAILPKPDRN